MESSQISLVQESWNSISSVKQKVGESFYQNLFEALPEAQSLVDEDIESQAAQLMSTLDTVVSNLDSLTDVLDELEQLAFIYSEDDIQAQHQEAIGSSLLLALEQALGDAWTEELTEAWTDVFMAMSAAMAENQEEETIETP